MFAYLTPDELSLRRHVTSTLNKKYGCRRVDTWFGKHFRELNFYCQDMLCSPITAKSAGRALRALLDETGF